MTSLLKHPIVLVTVTVVALFYYLSLDKSAQKADISSQTVQDLEQEIGQISGEVAILEKQLESANHPISQERIIRNELLMQKSGEYVLQLPTIEVTEKIPPPAESKTPWQEWKEILF